MPWGGCPFRLHAEPPEELDWLGALGAQQEVGVRGTFPLGSICLPAASPLALSPERGGLSTGIELWLLEAV